MASATTGVCFIGGTGGQRSLRKNKTKKEQNEKQTEMERDVAG